MANTRISGNSLVINNTGTNSSIPAGTISSSGNITGGNFITSGIVRATSVVANVVGDTVTATANVQGGNLRTTGLISSTGNVTGGNLFTAGFVSAQNTIYGPSASITGAITAGTLNVGTLTLASVSTAGNVTGGNLLTANNVSVGGNVRSGGNVSGLNLSTLNSSGVINGGIVSAIGNITGGNVSAVGSVRAAAFLNTNGTSATDGPAFIANQTVYQPIPYSPTPGVLPLIYNNVTKSTGGGYVVGNNTTGSIFTAPVSGYYQVNASIGVNPFNGLGYQGGGAIVLCRNAPSIAALIANPIAYTIAAGTFVQLLIVNGNYTTSQSSASVIVYLNAGDFIQAVLSGITNAPSGVWTTQTNLVPNSFQACWLRS